MTQLVAARNTCFAIVSAIEDDFRVEMQALAEANGASNDLLPQDVRNNALRRHSSDLRMRAPGTAITDLDLLPYIDFADIAKVISSRLVPLIPEEENWLSAISRTISELTQTRNRVCHSRPLEPDDLARLVEFANQLQTSKAPFSFYSVSTTLRRLEKEPTYVLTLQIPQFWTEDRKKVHNNLPVPEFDETGFLGRAADRAQVLKLLRSHYPVVTIVGEGGIGKTALALRCLYDVLDDPACPFDAVVWISLKTSALTQAGIRTLSGAITETLGLYSEIAHQLGTPKGGAHRVEGDLLQEVVEYLDLYRVLVAIDNLETLSTGSIRDLLLRVPAHSKVLLTSRVGVGEFEARYPLPPLDDKTSIALFRAYSRVLGSQQMSRLDEGNIKGYTRRLFNNPLLIKWFVAAIGLGATPATLLHPERDEFLSALSFCFENLFDRFGEKERLVIDCLSCARKPLTSAELRFLAPELNDVDSEAALSALHNSSLVSRTKSGQDDFEYSLSESAQKFIATKAPPSADLFKRIQSRLRELRVVLTGESILEQRYEFDPYFVRVGPGRDERIAATYLRRALDKMHRKEIDDARAFAANARHLAPHSAEAWRIAALIEEKCQEFYRASDYYDQAIQLDEKSTICRYCYAQFLVTDLDDLDGALDQFNAALDLAPTAPPLLQGKALTLTRMGRLEDAVAIHEALLPTLHTRERRWRLASADQAADCFRRLAFRAWEKKEFDQAKAAAKKALQIVVDSSLRLDLDEKLLRRTAKVINEALSKRELVHDSEFVEFMVTNSEKIHELAGGASIPVTVEAAWALNNPELPDSIRKRLQALDRYSETDSAAAVRQTNTALSEAVRPGKTNVGTVHNISIKGKFGFIETLDGKRWFFHRDFLKDPARWTQIEPDIRVRFSIGQNHRGECAIDVEPEL